MKWPGLIPLLGRIIAFPLVVVWCVVVIIWVIFTDGFHWWIDTITKDRN